MERQLLTVGEAMAQLRKHYPVVLTRLTNADRIIAFRNILVHGYHVVRDDIVWEIVQVHLPALRREAEAVLKEQEKNAGGSSGTP